MGDLYRGLPNASEDHRHASRIVRHRQAGLAAATDRAAREPGHRTARQLVQIFDAGSMPTAPDHFFAAYPLELDGAETEGVGFTPTAQSGPMVVDVLGHVPSVGDILVAYAVGGRWVAERGIGVGVISSANCAPCPIPLADLTLSWTNLLTGPGSATMFVSAAPNVWTTACVPSGFDSYRFAMSCFEGNIELAYEFFSNTTCAGTQSSGCDFAASSYSCSPFSITFTVTLACDGLYSGGYQTFTITGGPLPPVLKPPPIVKSLARPAPVRGSVRQGL